MPGTTPVYGFPYPEPTDLVADYPALGQDLAEDIEAVLPTVAGMTLVSPTSIANTGGTATSTNGTTTFTTVTTLSLNGIFASAAENYYFVMTWTQNTSAAAVRLRMRASGTDNTAAEYDQFRDYAAAGSRLNGLTYWDELLIGGTGDADTNFAVGNVMRPQATLPTLINIQSNYAASGAYPLSIFSVASHRASTSFDGISFIAAAGSITGTVRFYRMKGA